MMSYRFFFASSVTLFILANYSFCYYPTDIAHEGDDMIEETIQAMEKDEDMFWKQNDDAFDDKGNGDKKSGKLITKKEAEKDKKDKKKDNKKGKKDKKKEEEPLHVGTNDTTEKDAEETLTDTGDGKAVGPVAERPKSESDTGLGGTMTQE